MSSTTREALWNGILAVAEALPHTGNTSRIPGEFTNDGNVTTAHATYSNTEPNGNTKNYKITISIEESVDTHDYYWGQFRDHDDPTRRVVVDGTHYLIGNGNGGSRGFGGRRYDIAFFDGRTITTTDLWCQGTIPPKWRQKYPDNARFITSADRSKQS